MPEGIIIGKRPLVFKPSVADKFLFNKRIDKVIDDIHYELRSTNIISPTSQRFTPNPIIMGTNIISRFYFPYYG